MLIGEVLREVRKRKELSQGDIEHRTGLIRAYISRVENGHTIPSLRTLERLAIAMDVPLWQIIRGTAEGPIPRPLVEHSAETIPASSGIELRLVAGAFIKMSAKNRKLLVGIARRLT